MQPLYIPAKELYQHREVKFEEQMLILRHCKKYNVTKLLIETNFGDGIVAELFKKHLVNFDMCVQMLCFL